MTLGRALQDLGQHAEARAEFEYVLSLAPDNLAAIRGLAELHGGDEFEPAPHVAAPAVERIAAPALPPVEAAPIEPPAPEPPAHDEPDFAALDALIDQSDRSDQVDAASAAGAERAAQIERLEIWLARLEQARATTDDHAR